MKELGSLNPNYVHKIGSLLMIEHGDYSDRQTEGPFRFLKTITKREMVDVYNVAWRRDATLRDGETGDEEPIVGSFIPFLIKAGIVEMVDDVTSWHVGSSKYSRLDP